jgi:hypothetical protein
MSELLLERDVSQGERDKLADKGHALPDGSFPIKHTGDLGNAVKAFGRAKNKAAAKRHICKRAKDLGAEHMLPEGWKTQESSWEASEQRSRAVQGHRERLEEVDESPFNASRHPRDRRGRWRDVPGSDLARVGARSMTGVKQYSGTYQGHRGPVEVQSMHPHVFKVGYTYQSRMGPRDVEDFVSAADVHHARERIVKRHRGDLRGPVRVEHHAALKRQGQAVPGEQLDVFGDVHGHGVPIMVQRRVKPSNLIHGPRERRAADRAQAPSELARISRAHAERVAPGDAAGQVKAQSRFLLDTTKRKAERATPAAPAHPERTVGMRNIDALAHDPFATLAVASRRKRTLPGEDPTYVRDRTAATNIAGRGGKLHTAEDIAKAKAEIKRHVMAKFGGHMGPALVSVDVSDMDAAAYLSGTPIERLLPGGMGARSVPTATRHAHAVGARRPSDAHPWMTPAQTKAHDVMVAADRRENPLPPSGVSAQSVSRAGVVKAGTPEHAEILRGAGLTPSEPHTAESLQGKSLSALASIIRRDWQNPNYAAKPYLDAMRQLEHHDDNFGHDSGRSIMAYFLSNASGWKGPTAKLVKAELRRRGKSPRRREYAPHEPGNPDRRYAYS